MDDYTAEDFRWPPCEHCGSHGFPADIADDRPIVEIQIIGDDIAEEKVVGTKRLFLCVDCAIARDIKSEDLITRSWAEAIQADPSMITNLRYNPESLSYRG